MTLKRRQTRRLPSLTNRRILPSRRQRRLQAPDVKHLERLVETTRDEELAVGGERDRVDAVLVPLKLVEELTRLGVPDPDDRVETTGGEELAVWREDDGRDARVDRTVLGDGDVVDGESKNARSRLEIPHPSGLVAGAGDEAATVGGEGEGIDFRFVTGEDGGDAFLGEVPDLQAA